ncbi:hypothetical protein [Fodinicola feengrottensis]|uniref:hypothetical protein n=1 Tax=Fodinicola feengrottensis TaxID=435914 RepID=UPI0024419AF1|nr:hypothetical protein [Fodinicola feengrottensis]
MRNIDGKPLSRTAGVAIATLFAVLVILFGADPAAALPIRQGQWYLAPLQITQAQQLTRGQGVTVAVIDTGVDADVPELSGKGRQRHRLRPRVKAPTAVPTPKATAPRWRP